MNVENDMPFKKWYEKQETHSYAYRHAEFNAYLIWYTIVTLRQIRNTYI